MKTTRVQKPQLMPVTVGSPEVLQSTVNKLVEAMQPLVGQNKNQLEKAVTFADLNDSGFDLSGFFSGVGGPIIVNPPLPRPDPIIPPIVTGFTASATWEIAILSWNPSGYKGHAYVEVFRATGFKDEAKQIPTSVSDAVYIGLSNTTGMGDNVISNHDYRYWVRNVSTSGNRSDWHSQEGTHVFAPRSPSEYIDIISGEIKKDDLYIDLGKEIDKIPVLEVEFELLSLDMAALEVNVADNTAAVTQHSTAISGLEQSSASHTLQIAANTTSIDANTGNIASNTAAVTQHSTAISDLESAQATLTTQVNANTAATNQNTGDITTNKGLITQHSTAISNLESTTAQHTAQISANTSKTDANGISIANNTALITTQGTAISDLESSQATLTTQVNANTVATDKNTGDITTNKGLITQHSTAISGLESTTAQHTTQISANTVKTDANGNKIGENTALITTQGTAISDLESAQATLTTQVSTNTTTIQQNFTVTEAHGELIDATYTVKIDTGSVVTGFGLMVDDTGFSSFAVRAHRFYIAPPTVDGADLTDDYIPFIVEGNDVLIKNAYIDNAYIESLVTGSLIAENIVGQTITGTHIRGGDISIGNNFTVNGNGDIVATNAFLEGEIHADKGQLNNVLIAEDCTVLGTMQASQIIGDVYNYHMVTAPSSGTWKTVTKTNGALLPVTKMATIRVPSAAMSRAVTIRNFYVGMTASTSSNTIRGRIYARRANGVELARWTLYRHSNIQGDHQYMAGYKYLVDTKDSPVSDFYMTVIDGLILPPNETDIEFFIEVTSATDANTYTVKACVTLPGTVVDFQKQVEIRMSQITTDASIT